MAHRYGQRDQSKTSWEREKPLQLLCKPHDRRFGASLCEMWYCQVLFALSFFYLYFFWPLFAFMIAQLQTGDREREGMTCSKEPQAGFEPGPWGLFALVRNCAYYFHDSMIPLSNGIWRKMYLSLMSFYLTWIWFETHEHASQLLIIVTSRTSLIREIWTNPELDGPAPPIIVAKLCLDNCLEEGFSEWTTVAEKQTWLTFLLYVHSS